MWGDIPAWLTLALTAGALVYAAIQVRVAKDQRKDMVAAQSATARSVEGSMLLQIDDQLSRFAGLNARLRPGGDWHGDTGGPKSPEEWSTVEAYLGALERVGVMMDSKLLRPEVVVRLYGYRLRNICANDRIRVEKLEKRATGWKDLLQLISALEATGYPILPVRPTNPSGSHLSERHQDSTR